MERLSPFCIVASVAARWARGLLELLLLTALIACGGQLPTGTAPIRAEDAWARPATIMTEGTSAQPARGEMQHATGANSALYLQIFNDGQERLRLLAAQADVSQAVELHETRMEGDVMKMQQVEGGIEIPPGGQVELKPGGLHIMLIGLIRDLKVGDRFPVTLEFDDGSSIVVQAEVRQP